MNFREQLAKNLVDAIGGCWPELKLAEIEIDLEHPTVENYGDYASSVALKIAKKISQSPRDVASKLVEQLTKLEDTIWDKVDLAGPGFINFHLKKTVLLESLHSINQQKDQFGKNKTGSGKKLLVEHTSPNPNKAMHLGHLRNNVTGMAVANILEFNGFEVVRDCIDNNRGIAIAKLMWGYLKFARIDEKTPVDIGYWFDHQSEWLTDKKLNVRPDRFVDELYAKASQDFEENKEVEATVRQIVVDWEAGEEKNRLLWKTVLDYSYAGQEMTLKRLGNKFDWVWHEHEHYQEGKDIVAKGLETGVFVKTDEGVVITNLETYKIPNTVVIKSDGTSLYITQDLALTRLKRQKFSPDHLFWVIGPEQSLAMRQLFAVCEQLGIGKLSDFTHLPYGYMSIKGKGKMSSRKGNVIYIDELIDEAKEEIKSIILQNKGGDSINVDDVSEKVAIGAVKYSILKVGRLVDTVFDFATSLNFEGDSGPYLQYTYARGKSILRKALNGNNVDEPAKDWESLSLKPEELSLLSHLYRFEEVVLNAGQNYSPNVICTYLFELAKKFNGFYNNVQILNSQNKTELNFRLSLTLATTIVLKNGLALLGIEALEQM